MAYDRQEQGDINRMADERMFVMGEPPILTAILHELQAIRAALVAPAPPKFPATALRANPSIGVHYG